MKTCTKCGDEFPATLEHFYAQKDCKNGLHPWCKGCIKKQNRQWRKDNPERTQEINRKWREANLEEARERSRQWRKANPERMKELSRQWYEANLERVKKLNRQWYESNFEHVKELNRQWRKDNPEKAKSNAQRRRARKKGLPDTWGAADWGAALAYFNGQCAVCDRDILGLFHTAHADHWIPLSSEHCPGTVPTNMVPLCGGVDGCNNSKNDKEPIAWLHETYGKRKGNAILKRIKEYFSSLGGKD